jgi:PEP-CTERM motif-containing protein
MRKIVPALAAAFIATVGAGAAQAAVQNIDFSAVALCPATCTGITYTGPTLGGSTSIDLDGSSWLVVSVNVDDKSGLASGGSFDLTPTSGVYGALSGVVDFTLLHPITKTWTATVGPDAGDSFVETLTTLHEIARGVNAIAFTFTGSVTGGMFTAAPVDMVLSLTQAGGPGNVVSASLTNAGASVVPEPATWVMLVLGFAGLGYAAVRRSAKDRSAFAI